MDDALREEPYPFQEHMGFEMVDWSEGRAVFAMDLEPFHMNRYGIPHGGAYAVLLDTVMGYCGCWTGDPDRRRMAMTLSLNVSYLSRPRGTRLIAEGVKTGGGRRTFFAEGVIRCDLGEEVTRGSGVFRYRS